MTDAPVDLDELETLAKAATPGPWTHKSDINGLSNFVYKGSGMRRQVARTLKLSDDWDAAFIAAFNPAVALALIAGLRAARAAPPADEVAGLLNDCALLRDAISEIDEYARDNGSTESGTPFKDALDRLENHLKGKR